MSTNNPLNQYNTYSFHHFLVVASDTETAENISNDSESFFRFLRGDTAQEGVEVLVNPLSSMRYIIQELTIDNIISGDIKDTGSTSANAYMEGKMTILEPRSVRFFNHLYNTYRTLGASTGGKTAVWMIKTVFIGHKNVPQSGAVDYIANIKPIMIQPVDMQAEFTEAGGRYEVTFVMLTAGSGMMRMSNSNAMTVGSTVNLNGGSATTGTTTLAQAMKSLESRIRQNYELAYATEVKNGGSPEKVDFKINLSQRLQDPSYVLQGTPQQSAGGNGSVPIYAGSPHERLDQTIGSILKLCPKLMEEAKVDAPERWIAKVLANSTIVDPAKNNGYRTIEEFNIISNRLYSSTEITDGNYMEFDYVYTGRNVDILSYDMKMNFALAFFERITATASAASKGQVPAKDQFRSTKDEPIGGASGSAPMAAPTVNNSPATSQSVAPADVATYEQLLQQQLEVENIAVSMRIRGNPLLFNDMIVSRADVTRAMQAEQSTPSWLTGPVIVRVNVMMPSDDSATRFEKFWYDGVYRIISIRHAFNSDGTFTQDLEMVSMAENDRKTSEDSTVPREKAAQPAVEPTPELISAEPVGDRVPPRTLSISQAGIELLKREEGWRSSMYLDSVGKPTIGYGHLLTATERNTGMITIAGKQVEYASSGLTLEQGEQLLRQDIRDAEETVKRSITANLYQNEYDALVSFTFNVGGGAFSDSTLRTVVNAQQYTSAPEQFRLWVNGTVNGVKVPIKGLVNRRNAEIAMWGTAT